MSSHPIRDLQIFWMILWLLPVNCSTKQRDEGESWTKIMRS